MRSPPTAVWSIRNIPTGDTAKWDILLAGHPYAASIYDVRTGTGLTPVTDYTAGQTVRIQTCNSPIGVLAPAVIRLNSSSRFGGRSPERPHGHVPYNRG